MNEMSDRIAALEAVETRKSARAGVLTEAEGRTILRAFRRGLTGRQIGDAMGYASQNIRQSLGTWAIRFCHCHDEDNGQ